MADFNYKEALKELEAIAVKVEDPATGVDDIDKYIARADALVKACREYLRSVRAAADDME